MFKHKFLHPNFLIFRDILKNNSKTTDNPVFLTETVSVLSECEVQIEVVCNKPLTTDESVQITNCRIVADDYRFLQEIN